MLAADASSLVVEIGSGVGGAVIGGLTVWAAVAGKFGDLNARVGGVEKRLENVERKVDTQIEGLARVEGKIDQIAVQTDRREHPRP